MKISLHTDVLIELAESLQQPSDMDASLMSVLDTSANELWAPALCVAQAHEAVAESHGYESGRRFLEFVQSHMSSVPLRNSTLSSCLESGTGSLQVAAHLSAKSLVGIDAILSRELQPSEVNDIPCLSPESLVDQERQVDQGENVPFLDLKAQFSQVYNEIDDRITEIISTTGFILGHHVDEFEKAFAEMQGAKHCIGVSTGTDALHIAFMALGIGPGDEVIVPANTFIATAEGVSLAGATPVFVDSNEFYNIDIEKTRELLKDRASSGKVRAIAPVHLYGQPADLDGITSLAEEFDLAIVEDCAQAHLAEYKNRPVGNHGAFGAFSFYPGKNLGAFGEAGAVVTNDDALNKRARMLRAHGEATRYVHSIVGHNYRMEAMQGAVLATKAKYIAQWTALRQRNAGLYKKHLAGVADVRLPEDADFAKSVYHLFVIQVDNRDDLRSHLEQHGIATGLHYPVPCHLQQAYQGLGYGKGDFPVAESQAERIVSLPMFPELSEAQIERVCATIRDYYS